MTKKEHIPVQTQKGAAVIPERLKALNAREYFAVLATVDNGRPYTSLVSYALTPDMKYLIFATTKKTRKYANIIRSGQVALLIDNRSRNKKNLLGTEAITVTGVAKPVRKGGFRDKIARIFLAKHPDFEEFINSPATAFIAVEIVQCIHVNRFQTVSVWNFTESR